MTAFFTATQAIVSRLKTQWAAVPRTEPIFTANEARETEADPETGYLDCEIVFGEAIQASIGAGQSGNRFRHPGVIYVHIVVPSDEGEGLALELADIVAGIFRAQQFSGITCRAPTVKKRGNQRLQGDGNWYIVSVSTDFYYDADF